MKFRSTVVGLAIAGLAASSGTGAAITTGSPTTYGNLQWALSFTSATFATCTTLLIDATGDVRNGNQLVAYGALNCSNAQYGYGTTGSIYVGNDGTLNVTLNFGGHTLTCGRIIGWVGVCSLHDASNFPRGTATIRLL